MKFLTGIVTAWTDSEVNRHGCSGGSSVHIDPLRDGCILRVRRPEFVEVFIPGELLVDENEEQIRALVKQGCEQLVSSLRETLK